MKIYTFTRPDSWKAESCRKMGVSSKISDQGSAGDTTVLIMERENVAYEINVSVAKCIQLRLWEPLWDDG